jgi:hypothetical protein
MSYVVNEGSDLGLPNVDTLVNTSAGSPSGWVKSLRRGSSSTRKSSGNLRPPYASSICIIVHIIGKSAKTRHVFTTECIMAAHEVWNEVGASNIDL